VAACAQYCNQRGDGGRANHCDDHSALISSLSCTTAIAYIWLRL
jgi:hypothetical protein